MNAIKTVRQCFSGWKRGRRDMGKRKIPLDDGNVSEVNSSAFYVSKDFFNLLDAGDRTYYEIRAAWHRTFVSAAEHIGFDRGAQDNLWENLVQGNWKRLYLTPEEEAEPSTEWLDELKWQVFYCSDRWSLDRLTRCHWLFRAYQTAWMRENGTKSDLMEPERGDVKIEYIDRLNGRWYRAAYTSYAGTKASTRWREFREEAVTDWNTCILGPLSLHTYVDVGGSRSRGES